MFVNSTVVKIVMKFCIYVKTMAIVLMTNEQISASLRFTQLKNNAYKDLFIRFSYILILEINYKFKAGKE